MNGWWPGYKENELPAAFKLYRAALALKKAMDKLDRALERAKKRQIAEGTWTGDPPSSPS